jgi:hypothetical protein
LIFPEAAIARGLLDVIELEITEPDEQQSDADNDGQRGEKFFHFDSLCSFAPYTTVFANGMNLFSGGSESVGWASPTIPG